MSGEWLEFDEAFRREAEQRRDINSDKLCTYGITPLDDALVAIANNELVVIGADSGAGKSEIALHLAQHNAKKGKKVALYYLEGSYQEAIARMKWKDIADEYYTNYTHYGIDMDYRRWILNKNQDKLLLDVEAKIYEKYKDKYQNNIILYSTKDGLTLDMLISSLLDFHKFILAPIGSPFSLTDEYDLDLVIIDHLQYFSLTQAENEISEITKILRTVKNITDNYHIPVVLISHLRKRSKDRGLPDQEDFYGSSNIPKISTTSIILSPATTNEDLSEGIFPTYLRIVKSRIGIRPNYAILVNFDLKKRKYDTCYQLFSVNEKGQIAPEPVTENKLPKWAKEKDDRPT